MNLTKTVVGVFDQVSDAKSVVHDLESAGFSRDDISIIANKNVSGRENAAGTGDADPAITTDTGTNLATDAGIGAALGGVGGLLLSFAGLAIPGVGPVLAAGPIIAALSGAGIGAVAGGMIGALTESGVPQEEAHYYAEGVRRGHVLVAVRTDDSQAEHAREVMDRHGAVDVEGRVSNWRDRGWQNYSPGAEPLSADELRREREYSSAVKRQAGEWTREAHDIGTSLPRAEAQNAAIDKERTVSQAPDALEQASRKTGAMIGDTVRPLRNDPDNPSNFGDAIENNVRRPDSATVRTEAGSDSAMESAAQSAKRMAARVYDRTR